MPREIEQSIIEQIKGWFTPQSWPRRIRSLFTENIPQKLVALVVAILLYMLTTGEKNIVTSLKMRLEVVTPEGLLISNTLPSELLVSIQGPRSRINSVLNRNEVLTVNLADAKAGTSFAKINPQMLNLPSGVEVVSISPSVIEARLELIAKKSVPIKLTLEGEVAQGYRLVRYELQPPSVELRGSVASLDKIAEISTLPLLLVGLQETTVQEVALSVPAGDITYDRSLPIKANVEIEPIFRGKHFRKIPVSVVTRYKAVIIPANVEVKVRGPEIAMQNFTQENIKAEIDLSDKDPGVYTREVTIKVPHPLVVQSVKPNKVKVILK